MCIACELGYWSMVDALEAERSASKKTAAGADADFACATSAEQPRQRPSDEPRRE
jgi:hypothetical protein